MRHMCVCEIEGRHQKLLLINTRKGRFRHMAPQDAQDVDLGKFHLVS